MHPSSHALTSQAISSSAWIGTLLISQQECGHNSRCLLLPDGEALALDAWGHVAVETGDVRHLSPSTVTNAAIVYLRADGSALVTGMLEVKRQRRRLVSVLGSRSRIRVRVVRE